MKSAEVDFDKKQVTVTYDAKTTAPDKIMKAASGDFQFAVAG